MVCPLLRSQSRSPSSLSPNRAKYLPSGETVTHPEKPLGKAKARSWRPEGISQVRTIPSKLPVTACFPLAVKETEATPPLPFFSRARAPLGNVSSFLADSLAAGSFSPFFFGVLFCPSTLLPSDLWVFSLLRRRTTHHRLGVVE